MHVTFCIHLMYGIIIRHSMLSFYMAIILDSDFYNIRVETSSLRLSVVSKKKDQCRNIHPLSGTNT